MESSAVDLDLVWTLARKLPDVEYKESVRGAAVNVRGKLMACPAIHRSAEPNTLMVRIGMEERAKLIAQNPDRYYVTDHYRNYPSLLVRLSEIDTKTLERLLARSWQFVFEKAVRSKGKQ